MIVDLNTVVVTLCLNAFAKLQNARGASSHPVLMGIALLVYMCWPYQSTECFVISPLQVVCRARDLWPQVRCLLRRKSCHKIYAGKRTQKNSKHDKERR